MNLKIPIKDKRLPPKGTPTFLDEIQTNFPLIILGLLVGFLLAEGMVRIADPIPITAQRKDTLLGWANSENSDSDFAGALIEKTPGQFEPQFIRHIHINALGLRDINRRYEKSPGTFRILMLGDSMVAAFEVDLNETFSQKLESKLRQTRKKKVEVINAGVRGYSTIQEWLYYKELGRAFQPDLVILNYTHNDILDNIGAKHGVLGVEAERPILIQDVNTYLVQLPYLQKQGIGETIKGFFSPQVLPAYCRLCNIALLQIQRQFLQGRNEQRLKNETYFSTISTDENKTTWDIAREAILRLRDEVKEDHAAFMIGIFPPEVAIDRNQWLDLLEQNPYLKNENPSAHKVADFIKKIGSDKNILIMDPTAEMVEATQQGQRLFWPIDGHLTEEGHSIYANSLYGFIVTHGWG